MNNKFANLLARLGAVCLTVIMLASCSTMRGATNVEDAKEITPLAPAYLLGDIAGASATSLKETFGPPSLTRREGNGEYQRYDLSTCALIIILYPDDVGAVRAAHIDTTALNAGDAKPDLDDCLAAG